MCPPIYEYQCKECEKITEVIHKHDEAPKVKCKECVKNMQRILSLGGFNFKGGSPT